MMITLERVRAEDLETIIAIQRASFKAVYDKYQDEYDPYLEDRERIKWKLVERPNSYYYFVKDNEEKIGFLRINGSLVGNGSDFAPVSRERLWL